MEKRYTFGAILIGIIFFAGIWFYYLPRYKSVVDVQKKVINTPEIKGISSRMCDIRDYGAVESLEQKSTIAINEAINDCSNNGGGHIIIPEGEWLTGGVKMKSNTNLFLSEGAELHFTTDLDDYLPVEFTRFQGIEFYNYSPLIYAKDVENVAITGPGKLVGNGEMRTDWNGEGEFGIARERLFTMSQDGTPPEERIFGDEFPGLRPSFIQFVNSSKILFDGFTVENGPIWTIHPVYSEKIIARNLTINTWSANTDGFVIDSSKDVLIENSNFATGDDAIVIKSGLDDDGWRVGIPSEDIRIRNITVTKGSSGVSIGSEMSGGVRNVDIRDCTFLNTRHGFRIKSTRSRGGFIENVTVENVEISQSLGDAIDINLTYRSRLQGEKTAKPTIKNIWLKNIYGKKNERLAINVDGLSNHEMENVVMEDITFTESDRALSFKKARGVMLKNISIEAVEELTYEIENSENIVLDNSKCKEGISPCIVVSGGKTKNILLSDMNLDQENNLLKVSDGALRSQIIIKESL